MDPINKSINDMNCPYIENCLLATGDNAQMRSPISVGVGPFHAELGPNYGYHGHHHDYYDNYSPYPYYNYTYYNYPYYGYPYYPAPRPWYY